MRLRALVSFLAAVAALALVAGCGAGAGGKIMADTKVPTPENPEATLVPYIAPDISEITGIDEDEAEESSGEDAGEGAGDASAPAAEPKK